MSDQDSVGRRSTTCDAPPEAGCSFANAAANLAVQKTFAILGVDIHKPESVEAFREDLRFNKRVRKISDKVGILVLTVVVLSVTGATLSAMWFGIVEKIKGAP